MLRPRLRLRRRRPPAQEPASPRAQAIHVNGEQLHWKSNAVVELFRDGEVVLRLDLPLVIEEDDDGPYPLLASHNRDYDPNMTFDSIRVNTRHRALDEL